ncbi:cystathionine gamma-synthase family protein [Stakelama tenebrarum]|uniref:Cystathionine gamma-synthase family protein n=1 Tax=Stakelama tenebrarum TaxID=2711215 RepID=A0A6G6Y351_9SPHN|nr:cystathionine gamma-synthase family protein [Sphingosinithalassobacter tenebrarum]QIG79329.1 cystathionine gamma-synthase family protein [Sphingosinithalassobacter tenebrarum]
MSIADQKPSTIAVWAGEEKPLAFGAAQVPIVQSAPFAYDDMDTWAEVALGNAEGHIYSRNTNPTVGVFEEKCRILEGGEKAIAFASGMAAISNTLLAHLSPGDRVVSIRDSYGGTSRIFLDLLPRMGIDVELVETSDGDAIEAEIARGCKLVYLETPTNPTLKIIDLRRAIATAQDQGAITVVDNTFATPINQRPLTMGADMVLHSATKYLGGHDDAMGGVLIGREPLVRTVYEHREICGAVLSAFSAYLLLRGMKTLDLRVRKQNQTAMAVARFLAAHPKVESVFYPGLETHDKHDVAKRQMSGFGGMLSFSIDGDFDMLKRFVGHLHYVHRAASLGSVNTLIGPPSVTSHVECSAEQRAQLGISETLLRYSCGVEDADDLITQLDEALAVL